MREQLRGEMPFLDHLEELRWRIFKSVAALFIGTGVGFYLIDRFGVLDILVAPVAPYLADGRLIYLSPVDPFFFVLRTSILLGVILSFPILLYQVWSFLSPALEKREKRLIIPALYGGLFLFAFGVWGAYEFALPVSLRFLQGIQIDLLQASYTADEYLGFVTKLLLAFGVIFELPVVVLILSVLGLVTPKFLRTKRRHALVLITITASLLSPGDVITITMLMMVPLVVLYEFSILLSVLVWRGKDNADDENTIQPPGPADDTVEMDR